MAERWELVELIGQTGQSASRDKHLMAQQTAEAILDKIEPLIRVDERGRQAAASVAVDEFLIDNVKRIVLTELRAQVLRLTVLKLEGWDVVLLGDVLTLIDGGSDGPG